MRDESGIPEGWLLLIGIPPSGRILGSSILVVPLVTSKYLGHAMLQLKDRACIVDPYKFT